MANRSCRPIAPQSRKSSSLCFRLSVAAILCVCGTSFCAGFAAAPTAIDKAKEKYNKHNYPEAIKDFEALVKKTPSAVDAHYYLALSYMNARQYKKAKPEFEWVAKNGKDKAIVEYSQKAVASLTGGASKSAGALPSVLDFGAVWCVPCKKLEPVFDRVAENYKGKANFIHYDCDVGEGKRLADKYNIHLLPTVMFMAADGTMRAKRDGGNITQEDLIQNTDALLK